MCLREIHRPIFLHKMYIETMSECNEIMPVHVFYKIISVCNETTQLYNIHMQ